MNEPNNTIVSHSFSFDSSSATYASNNYHSSMAHLEYSLKQNMIRTGVLPQLDASFEKDCEIDVKQYWSFLSIYNCW